MQKITSLSPAGAEFIASFEGEILKAYQCPAGIWTIGIGSTLYEDGTPVKKGDVITKERSRALFSKTVQRDYCAKVNEKIKVNLTQNQYDAVVAFVYNCGVKSLYLDFGKYLNLGMYEVAMLKMQEYNKITDKVTKQKVFSKGLDRRRKAEVALFMQAKYK